MSSDTDTQPKNILFIMADQLRWDYLSCAGHPTLHTPNIDKLVERGVRFTQAYTQAPLCGPSRASFYTGRYMSSHGAMANSDPLKAGELTLSDYLLPLGYQSVLIGKTHTFTSKRGMERLGLSADLPTYQRLRNAGFVPEMVHEGLYPDQIVPPDLAYNRYLREQGFAHENPWEHISNTSTSVSGEQASGWLLRHARQPADIPEAHSETAFETNRAIEFVQQVDKTKPWCLHLSYIKPHWPLMASAPYHALYSEEDIPAQVRHADELQNPHPVYQAFQQLEYSQSYADADKRAHVIPTYMGLVKQLDDHIGRLMRVLEDEDLMNQTMIVFTSDHGDYLGDHWLGEKDLFHDCSSRLPMIVVDPSQAADATRGQTIDAFVEAIDILPTFLRFAGGDEVNMHEERLEGHALQPLLAGQRPEKWRDFVISEIDYSDRGARTILNQPPYDCRAWMIRNQDWKYVFYEGFRPQLFDLQQDPEEFFDLGESEAHQSVLAEFNQQLFTWLRKRKVRTEMPAHKLDAMGPEADEKYGIIIGRW